MNEEKEIGKKAASMLQSSLRGETGKFGKHVRGDKNALQNAQAKPRYRTSKRMDGTKQQYLKGIAIVMGRHGIEKGRLRKAHERTRHKPRETKYRVNAHGYRKGQPKRPFIQKVVDNSRTMEYLATELAQVRGEEIVTYLARGLENEVWVIGRQFGIDVAQVLIEGGKGSVPSDKHQLAFSLVRSERFAQLAI